MSVERIAVPVSFLDYEALVERLVEAEKWWKLHRDAEVMWEKTMMQAIGEDGVGSVAKAIHSLKDKVAELERQWDALQVSYNTAQHGYDALVVKVNELVSANAALEQRLSEASQKARNFEEVAHGLNSENDTLKQQLAAERAISSDLRNSMAAIHNTIRMDGVSTSLGELLSASKAAYDKSLLPVDG